MPYGPLLGIEPTEPCCIKLVLAQLQVAYAEALVALGFTRWIWPSSARRRQTKIG
jgi:hypothetical protein